MAPGHGETMDDFPAQALIDALASAPDGVPIAIALSGGMDSGALLHAAAHVPGLRERGLRALHVDHGISALSGDWARHCLALCSGLKLPLVVLAVRVEREGAGLEAAARKVRYAALQGAMHPGEILMTAHHADDQAETLLLRVLRGSGLHGLRSMQALRPLAPGWLCRPWLGTTRARIASYAAEHALVAVTDPSNADASHDRNFIRHEVLAAMTRRWPHAAERIAHSTALLQGASRALDVRNLRLLETLQEADGTLRCAELRSLDDFDLVEVLRAHLAQAGAPPPPSRVLALARAELLAAPQDAMPVLTWQGHSLRRFEDRLYVAAPLGAIPADWTAQWDVRDALALPAGLGTLSGDASEPLLLQVAFRRGGERMRVHAAGPHRPVRLLMQEARVPPWLRARTPLLFDEAGVAAVGTEILSDRLRERLAATGALLRWHQPPVPTLTAAIRAD